MKGRALAEADHNVIEAKLLLSNSCRRWKPASFLERNSAINIQLLVFLILLRWDCRYQCAVHGSRSRQSSSSLPLPYSACIAKRLYKKIAVSLIIIEWYYDAKKNNNSKDSRTEYTLGPEGPLLHKGVLVVLQSEQTRTTPSLGGLLLLLLLLEFCPCGSWSCCLLLLGFLVAIPSGFIIFLMILILEDIHLLDFIWSSSLACWSHMDRSGNDTGKLLDSWITAWSVNCKELWTVF